MPVDDPAGPDFVNVLTPRGTKALTVTDPKTGEERMPTRRVRWEEKPNPEVYEKPSQHSVKAWQMAHHKKGHYSTRNFQFYFNHTIASFLNDF